jgi:hypothetical protein
MQTGYQIINVSQVKLMSHYTCIPAGNNNKKKKRIKIEKKVVFQLNLP